MFRRVLDAPVGTPRSGPTCCARCRRPAGTTTPSSCARTGLLIGYVETPDLGAAVRGMQQREVNARWQEEMGEFFVDLDVPPDLGFIELTEVFHLEDQLA